MKSIKLNKENVSSLERSVSVPGYDRSSLSPSIVHIGLGNFHRAHQAAYLDELLERGIEKRGIFEINIVPDSFPLAQILDSQDYLYTLLTKSPDGKALARVSGSMIAYLNGAENKKAALERIAENSTTLITLTVTEKGYYYDKKTETPDSRETSVRHDLEHPDNPKTAAACLASALAMRYKNRSPLTVMCCDNIPSNGKLLENSVLFYCRELYPEIVSWVKDNVSFPSSMVDRITPVTTPALVSELEEHYGVVDSWPVCGEDFRQWVLEDNFKTSIPAYGEAGVQIVKDVEPYELMKMRLLNGSHSALAYASYLLGCRVVDEGITHPLIKTFIRDHYMEEVTPTLSPVPGIDLTQYKDTLVSRFGNRNIRDTILRLASEGTSKFPNFMLKPLSEIIKQGGEHDAVVFAIACWARFLEGKDEDGNDIPLDDVNGEMMREAALQAASSKDISHAEHFLITAGLANLSVEQMTNLAQKFKTTLDFIHLNGTKSALEKLLGK